mgnify:CR=1 FL=1
MFMKFSLLILLTSTVLCLTSCDYTTYVALRNYKESSKVQVYYNSTNPIFNSDTLRVLSLMTPISNSLVVRENISLDSYTFIAPSNSEIIFQPFSLGQPIKQIDIFHTKDSITRIILWDGKAYKKLKKLGIIKDKGFIFKTRIYIDNM